MKLFEQILDRAFINLMLSNRAWMETCNLVSRVHELKAREERRELYESILIKRGLNVVATEAENRLMAAKVDDLPEEIVWKTLDLYEGLGMLLWSVGLALRPIYDGASDSVNYNELLKDYRLDNELNLPKAHPPSLEEIEAQCEIEMIWNWRGVEGTIKQNRPIDTYSSIVKIFGENYIKYLDQIPIVPRGIHKGDLEVAGTPYGDLSPQLLQIVAIQARQHQRALEWVLNDETWDGTSADT